MFGYVSHGWILRCDQNRSVGAARRPEISDGCRVLDIVEDNKPWTCYGGLSLIKNTNDIRAYQLIETSRVRVLSSSWAGYGCQPLF